MINWPLMGLREYCQSRLKRKGKSNGKTVHSRTITKHSEAHRRFPSNDWITSLVSSLIEAVI